MTRYDLPAGTTVSTQLPGPAIALATSGVVTVNDLELAPGRGRLVAGNRRRHYPP